MALLQLIRDALLETGEVVLGIGLHLLQLGLVGVKGFLAEVLVVLVLLLHGIAKLADLVTALFLGSVILVLPAQHGLVDVLGQVVVGHDRVLVNVTDLEILKGATCALGGLGGLFFVTGGCGHQHDSSKQSKLGVMFNAIHFK